MRIALGAWLALALGLGACTAGDDDGGRPAGAASTSTTTRTTTTIGPFASLQRTGSLDALGVPDLGTEPRSRVFASSFESLDDFGTSYVTPQSDMTRHEISTERAHRGRAAHKGWLTGIGPAVPKRDGPNHRGYPTLQLWRLARGPLPTPCMIELWVWLDATLGPGEWFSLATLSPAPPNTWSRVVTVNVGSEGWLHAFHVPVHGQGRREFQTDAPFPMRRWVRVTTYLDLRPDGVIVVWQDGRLASAARIDGGRGDLVDAHFGLYAPPSLRSGTVFNDDLTIWRLGQDT